MKRTGPTKESTRKLAVGLEKQSKKSKKNIFRRIADEITKPTRHRVEVNLWKLNLMSKQFQGKTLVVPGKILSYGKLENPITVAAMSYSQNAKKAIKEIKGQALMLEELAEGKVQAKDLVLIK